MARINPFSLQMEITRMFDQGQSFFAISQVQTWLREHQHDPNEYEIIFHERPAPPGSGQVRVIEIELKRHDGQPVDEWLKQEVNRSEQ